MEKKRRHPLVPLLATCAAFHLTSCSLVGFLGGSIMDAAIPDEHIFSPAGVDSIKRGWIIHVKRTDGTTASGEFLGSATTTDETYAALYREFVATSPLGKLMPALGDSVRIITHGALGRGEQSGQFIGLSEGALRMQSKKYKGDVGVVLGSIDTVYHPRGPMIRGDTLRRYAADGEVPMATVKTRLLLSGDNGTAFIPIDEIRDIRFPDSNNRKWWGLGIGAALDAALIISLWANDWKIMLYQGH
jgi:hypothetical protein